MVFLWDAKYGTCHLFISFLPVSDVTLARCQKVLELYWTIYTYINIEANLIKSKYIQFKKQQYLN